MNEVIHIAKTYIRWEWQEQKQTHLFVGYRINGKGAGFSAVLRNNAIIITVFKRTIKKWEKKYE